MKDEIRTRFASEDEITLAATLEDLPYMNACLEEGLRMFPPAPIGFLRKIQPEGDVVDGHAVPGGVRLLLHLLTHLQSREFTDDRLPRLLSL